MSDQLEGDVKGKDVQSKEDIANLDQPQDSKVAEGATEQTDIEGIYEDTLKRLEEPILPTPSTQPQPDIQSQLLNRIERLENEKIELYRKAQSERNKREAAEKRTKGEDFGDFMEEKKEIDPDNAPLTRKDLMEIETQKEILRRQNVISTTINQLTATDPVLASNPWLQNHFAVGFQVVANQSEDALLNPAALTKRYIDNLDKYGAKLIKDSAKHKTQLPEINKACITIFQEGYKLGKQGTSAPKTQIPKESSIKTGIEHQGIKEIINNVPVLDKNKTENLTQSIDEMTKEIMGDLTAQKR